MLPGRPSSILVLCEGNHCRSPLAEGLLRQALPGVQVASAGLACTEGWGPHPLVVQFMGNHDIDLTRFRSRAFQPAMAEAADLILVMDRDQQAWCASLAPSARDRIHLLGHWLEPARQEIEDPYRKPHDVFIMVYRTIVDAVAAWRTHLLRLPEAP
ncbi:low molecular weight protein-tyrosine-phosphatase [Mesoterricola sediminis]|uniref:protein-tyrosine-phosphatase n=1 Tax=Mesoterricola sediminis TaxID=2927980 RepID=A0AA48GQU9_9BACT|nr:low molecular weight protein-tyrosine-phosphatase [Mesoterricola sediminis]BDU75924.1 protein-tyrosine-phosphatase [Mesoterricola sediminis]